MSCTAESVWSLKDEDVASHMRLLYFWLLAKVRRMCQPKGTATGYAGAILGDEPDEGSDAEPLAQQCAASLDHST